MADKYIDTSLTTGLNDGTSPANAWQSFRLVLLNTMASGSITAGDTIHVRTKNGASNCSDSFTVAITMVTPTSESNPTTFVFDDGTVWVGDAGQFEFGNDDASTLDLAKFVNFYGHGSDRRFKFMSSGNSSNSTTLRLSNNFIDGIEFNATSLGTSRQHLIGTSTDGRGIIKDLKFVTGASYNGEPYAVLVNDSSKFTLINPEFDISAATQNADKFLFKCALHGASIKVLGGKVVGAYDTMYLFDQDPGTNPRDYTNRIIGFDYGVIIPTLAPITDDVRNANISIIGNSSKPFDAVYKIGGASVDFIDGKNYPYLDSVLPNGNGWSYRVQPVHTNLGSYDTLLPIEKRYSQTASIKTLTIELLVNTAFTGLTNEDVFLNVVYMDSSTGEFKYLTTMNTSALTTSLAAWSNDTYGAKSYNKYKLEATTPTAIKTDSMLYAEIVTRIPAVGTGDFYFYNPDLGIS